jgi:hypothetical protein
VKLKESGGTTEDASDNYFTIITGKCNFGTAGFTLVGSYQPPYPEVPAYMHVGVFCSKQDPVQRLFCRNYYNPSAGNNGGIIFVFNASNPLQPVAQYDSGTVMYTNNPEAMWIDSLSVPGFDRIFYCHNGDYTFHRIDWNGSAFVNQVDFSHAYSLGIWRCCLKPNGDFITMNVSYNDCYFYLHKKSTNYGSSTLFTKKYNDFTGFTSGAWVQKMAYDPDINAILLLYKQQSVVETGKLYAIDADNGTVLFEDLNVFELASDASIAMGMNVDMINPDCRVIVYTKQNDYSGNAWIVRYSGNLKEKVTYSYTGFDYGPCNGDLQSDGTLWAAPDNNYGRFFKFQKPPDW